MLDRIKLIEFYCLGIINLRGNDIILASFPKSGSTWLRFIFLNVVSLYEWGGKNIDFNILNKTMVGLATNFSRNSTFKIIPKIIMTHRPHSFLFGRNRSILMIRDPRDVMVSYFNYMKGIDKSSLNLSFSEFIRNSKYGLRSWIKHYISWRPNSNVIISYEELKKTPYIAMEKLWDKLKINIDDGILNEAIKRSSFDNIRKIEEKKGLGEIGSLKRGYKFTRKGQIGDWNNWFNTDDLTFFWDIIHEYKDHINDLEYLK